MTVEMLFLWYPENVLVKQYEGCANSFKERFWIDKSETNADQKNCVVANHAVNVFLSSASKFDYF